jgi:hypothetical protein
VPTFADRGCHVVSVTDPYGRISNIIIIIIIIIIIAKWQKGGSEISHYASVGVAALAFCRNKFAFLLGAYFVKW